MWFLLSFRRPPAVALSASGGREEGVEGSALSLSLSLSLPRCLTPVEPAVLAPHTPRRPYTLLSSTSPLPVATLLSCRSGSPAFVVCPLCAGWSGWVGVCVLMGCSGGRASNAAENGEGWGWGGWDRLTDSKGDGEGGQRREEGRESSLAQEQLLPHVHPRRSMNRREQAHEGQETCMLRCCIVCFIPLPALSS